MEGRLRRPRHARRLAREHLAEEELAVDAAEADAALVAVLPHAAKEVVEHLGLGPPDAQQARRALEGRRALGTGGTDALDLPGRLARAGSPQRGHAVDDLGLAEQRPVAEIARGGDHVELEAEASGRRDAERRELLGQRAQRGERLDAIERALLARPLEVATHEQQGLALGRHDQVRVLRGPREIDEIGRLDEHRRVDLGRAQARLKAGDAIGQLGGGRRWRELHERDCTC